MKQIISDTNMSELLQAVIDIAELASERILEIYKTDFIVEDKADKSPLTAADMASHKTICNGLAKLTPNIPILSEESVGIPYQTRRSWSQYWLVDPLDGTREFVKKNGEFTVNIALIENQRSIMSVVYVPVTKLCYFAAINNGAYKLEPGQSPVKIRTKSTSAEYFTVAGSCSHGTKQQSKFIDHLGDNVEIMAIGSSLKICLVAEGKVDIYPRFGPTSEWDTAAAHCLVEEAGGIIIDTDFMPLRYNTKDPLLNPSFLVIADQEFDWKPYLNF